MDKAFEFPSRNMIRFNKQLIADLVNTGKCITTDKLQFALCNRSIEHEGVYYLHFSLPLEPAQTITTIKCGQCN